MTDKLDSDSRRDLILYKLEKSEKAIEESSLLADSGYYNTAINRLYYAAYYAASALMLEYSIDAATHKGIKTMLGLKFIHPGLLNRENGLIYQRLFDSRQAGDYEDFVYYDKESYYELLPLAKQFIEEVTSLIKDR